MKKTFSAKKLTTILFLCLALFLVSCAKDDTEIMVENIEPTPAETEQQAETEEKEQTETETEEQAPQVNEKEETDQQTETNLETEESSPLQPPEPTPNPTPNPQPTPTPQPQPQPQPNYIKDGTRRINANGEEEEYIRGFGWLPLQKPVIVEVADYELSGELIGY